MIKKIPALPVKDLLTKVSPQLKNFAEKHKDRLHFRAADKYSGKQKVAFFFWGGLTYFLALYVMTLLVKIAFSGNHIAAEAIRNGQSVSIDVASGSIAGSASNTATTPATSLTAIEGAEGMNPAPLATLTEQTEKGVLPAIAPDGTLPWKYYARPYAGQEKRPVVAIVFTNLGLSKPLTEDALKLPRTVTLGFSPYAGDIAKWAAKAREAGFESIADLPMQAEDYPLNDPGSFGLLEDLSPDENIAKMHSVMIQFPAFVGMLVPEGEKMTANKDEIKPYLAELKRRGLLFLYLKTAKNNDLQELIKANFYYALGIDKAIDADITRGAIETQLQGLVELAKKQGYAIGVAHAYPPTMTEVQSFAATIRDQGVDLVPVSAIASKVFP